MSVVRIEVSNENGGLYREFALYEGQLPLGMEERLQEMVDVINEDYAQQD